MPAAGAAGVKKRRGDGFTPEEEASLPKAVIYLMPMLCVKSAGKWKLSSMRLFAEVKRLLGSPRSEESLRCRFHSWKRARPAKWEKERAKARGDPDTYFREMVGDSWVEGW